MMGMSQTTTQLTDPKLHSATIQKSLNGLVRQLRGDIDQVEEPRFQALLETSAEVLLGLEKAFADYSEGKEKVWKK